MDKTQGRFTGRGFIPEFYEQLARVGVPLDKEIFYDGMSADDIARLRP